MFTYHKECFQSEGNNVTERSWMMTSQYLYRISVSKKYQISVKVVLVSDRSKDWYRLSLILSLCSKRENPFLCNFIHVDLSGSFLLCLWSSLYYDEMFTWIPLLRWKAFDPTPTLSVHVQIRRKNIKFWSEKKRTHKRCHVKTKSKRIGRSKVKAIIN